MFGVDDLRVLPRNYVECPLKNAFLINRREAQLHIRTYFPQYRKCAAAHLVYLGIEVDDALEISEQTEI